MRSLIVVSIAITMAVSLISQAISAAPKPAPAEMKIGVVDYQKVWSNYELTKKYRNEYEILVNKLEAQLARRDRNRLLTQDQLKELDSLYEKASPTDADKNRIKELEDEASKLDNEMKSLEVKKDATEAEKKRLEELRTLSKKTDESIESLRKAALTQLEETDNKWSKQVSDDIMAGIQKVAEQKGLSLILNKGAVLFGGTDITDAVVERLNKK